MLHATRSSERPRSFGRIVASALALTLCVAACKLETKAIPATQIVVDIQADAWIRERTRELELTATAAMGSPGSRPSNEVFDRTLRNLASATESSVWPVRLVFAPQASDARRTFELTVTARDADGAFIAQARVRTGYVQNEIRHALVRLTRACLRVHCGAGETCREAVCEDAWRPPNRLPLFRDTSERDAGLPVVKPADAGGDAEAGASDATSPDAAIPDASDADGATDAEVDAASDAAVDAGPWIDRCLSENGGCDPRVLCLDTLVGVLCGACPNGFADVRGDGTRCDDVDECARSLDDCADAYAVCTNVAGGYECGCAEGFYGDGRICSPNLPCGEEPSVCDPLATCNERDGTRLCVCKPGYEGSGGSCSDTDECAKFPCPAGATCVNTPGAFTCTCPAGFALQATGCVDIDECAAGTDDCDDDPDACVNTEGGFACTCPAGFRGAAIGAEGCDDINECRDNTDGCAREALCENRRGTFECLCDPGYSGPGRGANACSDLDECALGTANCSSNATCENTEGSYECRCNPGFSGNGRRCERSSSE